ncbi:uncharacterized protein LOC104585559 [Brachypodium distachyon]|nr:uncharacterized protein LOC104585559 [Brachypodium distachyon]|eukprot:XP_010240786.1 uncharacterized protein LOC104585559 [Brachypodium distachyon]
MGMEVFTVDVAAAAAPSWREIAADQPYPVTWYLPSRSVPGAIYWVIDIEHVKPCPHGLLRFDLKDETFSLTRLPESLPLGLMYFVDVMHGGVLCVNGFARREGAGEGEQTLTIWALLEDGDGASSRWEPRYSVHILYHCHPISLLPDGVAIMISLGPTVYRYQMDADELTALCDLTEFRYQRRRAGTFEPPWKKIPIFNFIPYTESLVPISAHLSNQL